MAVTSEGATFGQCITWLCVEKNNLWICSNNNNNSSNNHTVSNNNHINNTNSKNRNKNNDNIYICRSVLAYIITLYIYLHKMNNSNIYIYICIDTCTSCVYMHVYMQITLYRENICRHKDTQLWNPSTYSSCTSEPHWPCPGLLCHLRRTDMIFKDLSSTWDPVEFSVVDIHSVRTWKWP